MTKPAALVACFAFTVFAAGAVAQSVQPFSVREAMAREVNPAVLAIWDVGNNGMNDQGGIDPGKMDAERWDIIQAQAEALATVGRAMATAGAFVAATTGNHEVGEGEVTMAQIRRRLDADPAGYRQMSAAFADHADRLAAAARARDPVMTGDLIGEMDAVCEGCHARYWYPE